MKLGEFWSSVGNRNHCLINITKNRKLNKERSNNLDSDAG